MGESKKVKKSEKEVPISRTLDERETRCVSYATAQAEKMLADGTAPNSIVLHYLREGTNKRKQENEKLKYEIELVKAKTEAIKAQQRSDEMLAEALKCFRHYNGEDENDEER